MSGVRRVSLRPREYYDSVRLMQVSEFLRREAEGVREAIVMMATPNNKKILAGVGFAGEDVRNAAADDLVIAVVADTEAAADAAITLAGERLRQRAGGEGAQRFRSLDSALAATAGASLALISVPGAYAAAEARRALERGLHVMLFSDNVTIEDERALKEFAVSRNLLMMGPDCGTALFGGKGLGFANVVRPGPVGIVGASGTGIQAITSMLDGLGSGVSQAIGTGGRDLKAEVGGLMMLAGIERLEADPATEVIVLTSKPPAAAVAAKVLERARACTKPVVINFLGAAPQPDSAGLRFVDTLEAAALAAAALLGVEIKLPAEASLPSAAALARLAPGQRYLRGLYSGGTLCYEAKLLLEPQLSDLHSNLSSDPAHQLPDLSRSIGHALIDLGDDAYTQSRPHPMIDPAAREQRLRQEMADPEVAVILLDVVLGYASHLDPAGRLAAEISSALAAARAAGRELFVIASVCGTEADPQQRSLQEQALVDAGVLLAPTNAAAVRLCARLMQAIGSKA